MVTSAVSLIVCRWLHLPVVLGYILAGFVIGPFSPPYSLVTDLHSIHTLSTLGVIFLLFCIALEFSFKKLAKVGLVAFVAATVEIFLMVGIGFLLGKYLGWRLMDSLFLGALLSISSTTIIAKILLETGKIKEKFAEVILGILIVEDLWAIVIIALLSGIATTGALTLGEISISMIKVFAFVTMIIFFGFWGVPRLLNYIERFHLAEVMIVVVLGLCLGVSLIAAKAGFSIALGAFLIGAVIAETRQAHGIVIKMEPIRDMFTAIFFVSVGLMIEPTILRQFAVPIIIIALVTIIAKICSCTLATFLTGYDSRTSMRVGLGLAQIGEFSFIIAQLGQDTEVTSPYLYPIAVSVSAITTISTPFLMKNADAIINQIKRFAPKPLVTLESLYPAWLAKIGQPEVSSPRRRFIWRDVKQYLPKVFFYAMSIAAVYFIADQYVSIFAVSKDVYWGVVCVLMFPLFIGFAYWLDKIVWEGVILNMVGHEAEIKKAKTTTDFFHNASRFFVILFTGLIFVSLVARIVPAFPWGVSIIILVLAAGALLLRSVNRVHEYMEKTIMGVFDNEKPLSPEEVRFTHDQIVDLIRTNYPLSFETQDFLLPLMECGINRTIKELDLRSKTGASVVGIYREEEIIANPSADTKLLPGDVLLLIGDDEQIKTAVQYLNGRIKEV